MHYLVLASCLHPSCRKGAGGRDIRGREIGSGFPPEARTRAADIETLNKLSESLERVRIVL